MKPALAIISIALALTLALACGQEPAPPPTPPAAPTATTTPIPPTNTPVAGPVSASNIPLPTRAPIITPTPAPTSTPRPTRTPVSLEFAILNSVREFTSKAGDGYAFHMNGVLSVRTSDGLDLEISLTYTGDAMPGYNSASVSLAAPSQTVEYDVITHQNISEASGETVETGRALFDTETRRWIETEDLLALSTLTDLRVLLGFDLYETSDIVTDGRMKLAGRQTLNGVSAHVISGKLPGADISGTETDLEVTYRVGVDDALLRQVEISGDLDPSIIDALLDDLSADSVRAELTVKFSEYGKEVAHKSPHLAWPRFNHYATLLDDGRVLVSGGWTGEFDNDDQLIGFPAGIPQIYDPLTSTWTFKGKLDPDAWEEIPDLFPQTPPARLPDGRLVSVAILDVPHSHPHPHDIDDYSFGALAVFNTETDEWTRLSDAPVPTDRSFPDAIVLNDGRALVVGGTEIGRSASASFDPLAVVEAYDLSTGAWQTLEPMNLPARQRWLVTLHDGRVLAAGGFITEPDMARWLNEAEIYDPHTNTWTPAESMTAPHTRAIVLHDGRVLATGGALSRTDSLVSETYNPETGAWTTTGAMTRPRSNHTLTLLPDGRVLAAGGIGPLGDIVLSTTDIFDPATGAWSPGPELSQPRANHSATLMPDGSALIAGGISERNGERYITLSTEFITP